MYLLSAGVDGDSPLHALELRGAHLRGWQKVNVGFACGGDSPGSCRSIRILQRVTMLVTGDNGTGGGGGVLCWWS